MRRNEAAWAAAADLVLALLDKAENNPSFFDEAARREGISKNQLIAAAIVQALSEHLDSAVFGTE